MKRRSVFNDSQTKLLISCFLNPSEWSLLMENENHLRIINLSTGKKLTVDKKRKE